MSVRRNIRRFGRPSDPAGEGRPVRRVLVFAIVALALIMMSVDSTIVATALHSLQDGLHTSINWAGWTITAYAFGVVLMLPVSGELSERYGSFKIFLISVVVFTAASLFCGLADNIYVLIALRALQAIGGAGFTPSATAIIVDRFGDQRDLAVSLFGSIFSIGSMIGPIFGGLFVSYWSWRGIFFVNVPIGLIVIALALHFIPRDPPQEPGSRRGIDAIGTVLLGVGIFAAMLPASYLGEKEANLSSPMFIIPTAIAIVTLWAFFHHIHRSANPLIDPHLIHGSGFGAINLVNGIFGGVTGGAVALVPLYATNRYGLNALDSGTLLIAEGVAAILLSAVAALILRRTGYRSPLYIGNVIITVGLVLLALRPPAGISPYLWLAFSSLLLGAGAGAINPAGRNAGLQMEPERSSPIAAIRSMSMQIGTIAIVTIATAILATSKHPGLSQGTIFLITALLFAVCMPLVAFVPEHHGSW